MKHSPSSGVVSPPVAAAPATPPRSRRASRLAPPDRLAATAFGENQPLDLADTPDVYARNRRIEFKFTER